MGLKTVVPDDDAEAGPGSGSAPRLYERAFEILADKIMRGEIAAGEVLRETAVAGQFGISRAPARRALVELEAAGHLLRLPTGGYRVKRGRLSRDPGGSAETARPDDARLVSTSSWERIYGEVEGEIAARISFARWRLNEAELARYYRVSRTVARDVIGRLQQRGVVRKDDKSRWYAPALTPDHVGELYELRWLLEPVALRQAAANVPPALLDELRGKLGAATAPVVDGETLDDLERDLHVTLLGFCGNQTLMQAITLPHSLLIAHRYLYKWTSKLFPAEPFLPEHTEILNRFAAGNVEEAAVSLELHLRVSRDRAISRIETIARMPPPRPLPYLEPSPR